MGSCQRSREDLLLNTDYAHYLGGGIGLWGVELVTSGTGWGYISDLDGIAHLMETWNYIMPEFLSKNDPKENRMGETNDEW